MCLSINAQHLLRKVLVILENFAPGKSARIQRHVVSMDLLAGFVVGFSIFACPIIVTKRDRQTPFALDYLVVFADDFRERVVDVRVVYTVDGTDDTVACFSITLHTGNILAILGLVKLGICPSHA
jgi:hypothetical protein